MVYYIQVTDADDSEAIEIPSEDDGSLPVETLSAQYPGATGLKYRLDGHTRAVKLTNGVLYPPENGWGNTVYYCIFPKDSSKRKADDALETSESKTSKTDSESKWVNTDLVVLGLPWKTTDKELREYFSKYGELQLAQVKVDPMTKKSKGYGFIRFANQEVQVRVMLQRHQIDGRWCDVRIPVSKDSVGKKSPYKVFIGQCTEDLTEDVLRDYFSQFGEISDLYVPKPFRAFAFVTYIDADSAKNVCTREHKIRETKVYVTEAVPKGETEKYERGGGGGGQSRSGASGGAAKGRRGAGDYYGGGGGASYDDYYGSRRPWASDREDSWREGRWSGGGGGGDYAKDSSWKSASSDWSRAPAGRWRDNGAQAADASIDPDLVASVVNKAVMGVIGNLKGGPAAAASELAQNGGAYKDEWWSRR